MRHGFLLCFCFTLFAFFLPGAESVRAQHDLSDVEIETRHVRDTIYMLSGAGGNVGLFIGDDHVLLIDDSFAPLSDDILAAVAALTDKPVSLVINTHWHPDHTGGNENMGAAGAVVIAHDNVIPRKHQKHFSLLFDRVSPADPANAPTASFSRGITFHDGGQSIAVHHVANAHTDGDSVVHFPASKVFHTGDVMFADRYPFIDVCTGGSVDGVIAALDFLLGESAQEALFIPGHGPLADKAKVLTYRNMLVLLRDRVAAAVADGMTLQQAQQAGLTADLDEDWSSPLVGPDKIVKYLYLSLADVDTAPYCDPDR